MKKTGWLSLLLLLLVTVTPAFAGTARLEPGPAVCEWCYPKIGDFNGDGLDDLVVNHTTIYFNRGGRFDTAIDAPGLPKGHYMMAVADFNADGFDDAIMKAPGNPSGISRLYLNNGSGGFIAGKQIPGEVEAVVELNGDGKPDLVVAALAAFTLALNNGDGTFSPYHSVPTGDPTRYGSGGSLAAGDFNNDGHVDFVVTRRAYASFYFGNEDGTVGAPVTRYTYAWLGSPRVEDVNGDGNADIVAGAGLSPQDSRVVVLFGDGTGRFPAFAQVKSDSIESRQISFAVGDFFEGGGKELAIGMPQGDVVVYSTAGRQLREITRITTVPVNVFAARLRADGTTDLLSVSTGRPGPQRSNLLFTDGGAETPSAAATTVPRGRSRAVRSGTNAVPEGRFEVEVTGPCSANLSGLWNLRREGIFVEFDRIPGTSRIDAAGFDDEIHVLFHVTEGAATRVLEGTLTQKGNRISGIMVENNPPCGDLWAPHFVDGTRR